MTMPAILTDDVDFSISQFAGAWRLLCGATPHRVFDRTADIEYVFSGLPIPFFNAAVVTARDVTQDGLERLAADATRWASDKAVPWMFLVTHEAVAADVDVSSTLASHGLVPLIQMTGMRAQRLAPSRRQADELDLDIPRDDDGYAAIFDVNAAAYGVRLDACKPTHGTRPFWDGHQPALGRVNGTPVSSAAVFLVDGCRYVALVATLPDRQRRGYAEAAMRHALDAAAAAHGDLPTTLHATEAGRPIYTRMGYEPIASHTAFIETRFLEGH